MSVYVYRPTTKTIATTAGRRAVVHECMGPGPNWRASDQAIAAWERKIATGYKRAALPKFEGATLYAEGDEDGAAVYVGRPGVYADSRDYEVAKDGNGDPITVVNPRKRNAVIEVVPADLPTQFEVYLKIGGDRRIYMGRSDDTTKIEADAERLAKADGARNVYTSRAYFPGV